MATENIAATIALGLNAERPSRTLGLGAGSRIRIIGGARGPVAPAEPDNRRRSSRVSPDQTRWADGARLRGGLDVRVIDIGERGILIESPTRLHIGTRVEVCLFSADLHTRLELSGTVRRCHVARLDPLTYRGALEFDDPIAVQSLEPFVTEQPLSA